MLPLVSRMGSQVAGDAGTEVAISLGTSFGTF